MSTRINAVKGLEDITAIRKACMNSPLDKYHRNLLNIMATYSTWASDASAQFDSIRLDYLRLAKELLDSVNRDTGYLTTWLESQ